MNSLPPLTCVPHGVPECPACKATPANGKKGDRTKPIGWQNHKPHGPVSEHLMRHWYGAKK
jgi:hypothetical protein